MVLEGDRDAAIDHARTFILESLGLAISGNPDVRITEYERFSIADARILKEQASHTPLGEAQVFVIATSAILHEAQNALLKLFEEPAARTSFILIVPSLTLLLPTVRSRVTYGGCFRGEVAEAEFAQTFLTGTVGERLALLEPVLKDKDRERARAIVDALEASLHAGGVREHYRALEELAFVRSYLFDRSSSLKSLLSHLAVTL
jgi:hypothetical protein